MRAKKSGTGTRGAGKEMAGAILIAVLAAAAALSAQQTPAPPAAQPSPSQPPQNAGKISTETKLVTVYTTVRDKHGKIIPTLNKEDFTITDDGHPQTVAYFARQNDQPLTLGLLVDTSMSQARVLDDERSAGYTFLDHMLHQEKDAAFVLHFDREVELLQDITGVRPKLQAALQLLAIYRPSNDDDNNGSNRGSRGGTQLYDTVYLASHELLTKQKGRKAVFVLTDGNDRGSRETLEDAIEAAQHADTSVYAIYFPGDEGNRDRGYGRGGGGSPRVGVGWPGGGTGPGGGGGGGHRGGGQPQEQREDGKKILDRMTRETGGRLFEISKKLPLDQAFAQVEEELRNQYTLGYTPNPADTDGGYHRIKVTVPDKDDTVQARDGYYSGD